LDDLVGSALHNLSLRFTILLITWAIVLFPVCGARLVGVGRIDSPHSVRPIHPQAEDRCSAEIGINSSLSKAPSFTILFRSCFFLPVPKNDRRTLCQMPPLDRALNAQHPIQGHTRYPPPYPSPIYHKSRPYSQSKRSVQAFCLSDHMAFLLEPLFLHVLHVIISSSSRGDGHGRGAENRT
jgi:hypothetical protein